MDTKLRFFLWEIGRRRKIGKQYISQKVTFVFYLISKEEKIILLEDPF